MFRLFWSILLPENDNLEDVEWIGSKILSKLPKTFVLYIYLDDNVRKLEINFASDKQNEKFSFA